MTRDWRFRPATEADLAFARTLTRRNMMAYYCEYDLLWQEEAFDIAWAGRQNALLCEGEQVLGFVSFSRDARALYIRELQLIEAGRGRGLGGWLIIQARDIAFREGRPEVRLTVFKSNPARRLYERMGLEVVGEDECFFRMSVGAVKSSGGIG
ncbi:MULTISPECIES: GNAT family N-acetyltransferase [Pseudomonas]|uniref:Acetyltransferase n=1 Tax=Pseudomonas asplenii TaxID=53407 RepID=A0A0N0VIK9_9PSED|nr:GNAT family N-acetyltransferase [Pseudomonas fuscovaginae]KPA87766.1 acetyltransferase [Pseudomonas fuscovaginae]KPA95518.1 acetyltransferase [Pseudomonas fuscovaginae]